MTNPTRQDIIDAHNALKELAKYGGHQQDLTSNGDYFRLLDTVSKAFPPKPTPTMADVEWDDSSHYLAEAEQVARGHVIMLEVISTGEIRCLTKGLGEIQIFLVSPETLTPTGFRYALEEV